MKHVGKAGGAMLLSSWVDALLHAVDASLHTVDASLLAADASMHAVHVLLHVVDTSFLPKHGACS